MAPTTSEKTYSPLPTTPIHQFELDLEKAVPHSKMPASYGTLNEKHETDGLFPSHGQTFEARALETIVISLFVSMLVVGAFTLGACLVVVWL
ncbi:hypothetical protein MMC25_001055 [Agyrium rufum]|nr:hypothetical protein [Agyrium rufum]